MHRSKPLLHHALDGSEHPARPLLLLHFYLLHLAQLTTKLDLAQQIRPEEEVKVAVILHSSCDPTRMCEYKVVSHGILISYVLPPLP